MKAMDAVWDVAPREEQEAFHAFTVHNSREPLVMTRMAALQSRMEAALEATGGTYTDSN